MGAVCPECGVHLLHNVSGVMKTSAVMISVRGESGFYNSVQEVPEPLRAQLLETTASQNSGTIVIADRAGKEQLTQALARREAVSDSSSRAAAPIPASSSQVTQAPLQTRRLEWLAWVGLILVLGLAAVACAFFYLHW
jgi:hypothetical protein